MPALALVLLTLAGLLALSITHTVQAVKGALGVLDEWRGVDGRDVRRLTLRLLAVALGVVGALWLGPQAAWMVEGPEVPGGLWWVGGVGLGLTSQALYHQLEDMVPGWMQTIDSTVRGLLGGGRGNR